MFPFVVQTGGPVVKLVSMFLPSIVFAMIDSSWLPR